MGWNFLDRNNRCYFRLPKEQAASTALKGWIESRGHRMNLESINTHIGVGVAFGEDGSFYAVHLTGTPKKKAVGEHAGMPRSFRSGSGDSELAW